MVDRFPELSETFVTGEVRGLRTAGLAVRVEALAHAARPAAEREPARIWEDEGRRQRLAAAAWLVARHPLRCAGDLLARRRWRRQEPVAPLRSLAPAARRLARSPGAHLHAHFAAGAALAALRLGRLVGRPFSVTAHAYDIYQRPANLAEKLRAAAFSTSGCAYTVRTLREVAGPAHADRVHEIVMGIDPSAWPAPASRRAGRRVLAVGRLVEKKGFADLVEAAALLRARGEPLEAVTIVGDGPERGALIDRIAALDLGDVVRLAGARAHGDLRGALAAADVFCMPCVVAPDGDRDSMPVVVKEALAMELPVVATDEVGLPELVRPRWGRLVAPRDPDGLATGLAEVLAHSADERATMGAAGRRHVLEHCDLYREAAKLAELIASARSPASGAPQQPG